MARRYGRNQRRQHRAELAAAQAREAHTREFYEKALFDQKMKTHRAENLLGEVAERIARACGPESALIPIGVQMKRQYGTPIRWPVVHGPNVDMSPLMDDRITFYQVDHVDLLRLVTLVERDPISFNTLVRMVNTNPADGFKDRAYMVSCDALRRIGWTDHDLRYLVEDIVHKFMTLQAGLRRSNG